MSGSALMSLGTRAMFAASAGLQVTGHNIANAGVEGYSRQQVSLQTATGQFNGAGFFGKGADVASVTRIYDEHLTRQAAATQSQAAYDRTRYEQLTRMEQAFPMGESGIGYAANQLFNAMSDLASRPQDISAREVVLSRARELAARFNAAAGQLDALQTAVTGDLRLNIATANELTARIADVNQQIAAVKGLEAPPNDLLDQRDQLVKQLSGLVQVSTVEADDGTLSVFISGGQRLVMGNRAETLRVVGDPDDLTHAAIGIVDDTGLRLLPTDTLGSGAVGGLLRFQNDDLATGQAMLDELAQALADRVNAQQGSGFDLDGAAGGPLFDPTGPSSNAAASMRVLFADPRGIAAASADADNGNALAMAALRDERFVDTARFPDTTFTEAYSAAIGSIGVRVQGARTSTEISTAVAASAEEQRAAKSGVNLDEEAARMIQYQQSYQAAAKVLQIAQSVFQTLLDTAGV